MNSDSEMQQLIDALKKSNLLLRQQVHLSRSWKIPLRNGVLAGFGGVLGATVLVSLLVLLLRPFVSASPVIQNLSDELQQAHVRRTHS
jgi:hypothetical protein